MGLMPLREVSSGQGSFNCSKKYYMEIKEEDKRKA
jgi:hypothetical protein